MKKMPWVFLCIVIIAADQLSKYWAVTHLLPYQPNPMMPMLNLTLAFNTGAAFSLFHDSGVWHAWFFLIFGCGMSVGLLIVLVRMSADATIQLCAVSMILAGAVGNLLDRIRMGYVIDFIQVYYHEYYWPIFNVADSAICVAAMLLVLQSWRAEK